MLLPAPTECGRDGRGGGRRRVRTISWTPPAETAVVNGAACGAECTKSSAVGLISGLEYLFLIFAFSFDSAEPVESVSVTGRRQMRALEQLSRPLSSRK